MCPDLNISAHAAVILQSLLVCYLEDIFSDIQNPDILDACLGDSIPLSFPTSCDDILSVAYMSDSCHFLSWSHLNSIIYHFVFSPQTCPPVDLSPHTEILSPFYGSLTVSSRGSICCGRHLYDCVIVYETVT